MAWTVPSPKVVVCGNCEAENGPADVFCFRCGRRIEPMRKEARSALPLWCAVLMFVAGGLALAQYMLLTLVGQAASADPAYAMVSTLLTSCGMIGMILSVVPLVGGIMCLRRSFWGALGGSLVGLVLLGPYGISTILSLANIIIILLSRSEFRPSHLPY